MKKENTNTLSGQRLDEEWEIKGLAIGLNSTEESVQIINHAGNHVAQVEIYPTLETAKLICNAVNHFEEMKEALEYAARCMENGNFKQYIGSKPFENGLYQTIQKALQKLNS